MKKPIDTANVLHERKKKKERRKKNREKTKNYKRATAKC